MVAGGNVYPNDSFLISPNRSRVIYKADQDTDGVWELYGVFDKTNILLFMPAILSGSTDNKIERAIRE